MSSLDRRSMLTALFGATIAAGALGSVGSTAMAVPRVAPPKPAEKDLAAAATEAAETVEGNLHNAQYIVVRRRRRRRWRVYRPIRRRRRVIILR